MPFVFALACLGATPALAAVYTWTGKAPAPDNQDWANVQNWSPSNSVPGAGDTAIIVPVNSSGFTVKVDQSVTVANLTVITSILQGGGSLAVSGNMEAQNASLGCAGGITITGTGTLNVDPVAGIPVYNTTTLACPLTMNGTATVSSNGVLQINGGITAINNHNFILADGAQLSLASSGAWFINNSSFVGGNAICSTGSSIFSNAPSGYITASGGSELKFHGTLADNGSFSPAPNGVIYVDSATALHAGAQFTGAGVTELVGAITLDGQVSSGGNLQLGDPASSLPVLTMNGLLEVSSGGGLTWLGGTLQGVGTSVTGTIQIDNGGTMLLNQYNYMAIRNIIVTNSGTINCTNQGTVYIGYNAEIDNAGSFNLWNDGDLSPFVSGTAGYNLATFNNYGTLEKQLGATNYYSIIGIPVNSGVVANGGIIKADQRATLLLNAGGVIGTLQGQGQIRLTGGTFLASPNAATVGSFVAPRILLNGSAVLNLANDFKLVGGTFELDPGATITGPGTFMATYGNFVWAGGTIDLTGPGVFRAGTSCTFTIAGAGNVKVFKRGSLLNFGTVVWQGDNNTGGIRAYDGVVFVNYNYWNCKCDAGIYDYSTNTPPVFTNGFNGWVVKPSPSTTGTSYFDLPFVNQGKVQVSSGTVDILSYDDSGPDPNYAQVVLQFGGKLVVDTAVIFHGTVSGTGQLTGSHGETIVGSLNADQIGVGSDLTNAGKTTAGDAPGIISYLAGNNYYQTTNGTLVIPIRGTNAVTPDFGQLKLTGYGQITLAGTLEVDITEGYAPPVGATFPFLTSYQRNGTFNNVVLPPGMQLNYNSGGATLVVTGAVPVQIISPAATNGQFQFGFNTISNRSYTVQYKDDLTSGTWMFLTNFTGDGSYWQAPPPLPLVAQRYFRVSNP
jgi:hypothetical protein